MTSAKIVNAANREWIAGLAWRSFRDAPTLAERRDDAKELNADWVAVRNTPEVIQAGFCKKISGRKPRRLFSIAAAVAESQRQPWLGTFKLSDDLWWYIAVRDGQAVLPDGDVIGDYETVMEARRRHESYDSWDYIQDGTIDDILPILLDARGRDKLVPVKSVEPISPWRIATPAIAGGAIILAGLWLWNRHVEAEERARAQALAAERAKILAEQRAVSPLKSAPTPEVWLRACDKAIGPSRLTDDGWALASASCGVSAATLKWKRLPLATVGDRPKGALSNDGNSVVEVIPFGPLTPGKDTAHGLTAGRLALFEILQPIGVQLKASAPPSKPRLPGARDAHKPPKIPSQSVQFTLPISPFGIDFNEVPGLRLTFATHSRTGWKVEGMLYGR